MAKTNKLSIYLIKQEFESDDSLIVNNNARLLTEVEGVGKVYFQPSYSNQPAWVTSFFGNSIDASGIFSANSRLVLICRINVREHEQTISKAFAVVMGRGKYLLAENVIEDDFGLRVVLNTISHDSLRKINKVNIGGNLKSSNEQMPLKSDIDAFGFDLDRDLIGSITAHSNDDSYVTGMISGSDLLSVTAEVDITNICDFLKQTYNRFKQTTYKENFGWVDHIKKVKDSRLVAQLDQEVTRLILENSPLIWMAVPEVIDWENISGFRYSSNGPIYDDIDISEVIHSFRSGFSQIDQLKHGKRIEAISRLDGDVYTFWSAYRCLCGEFEHDEKTYCINNGRWFCIDKDYVSTINADYHATAISDISFIEFTDEFVSENDYSTTFVATNPNEMICMDKQNISHGGGQSKVELCDILTKDGTYIHIKPYSGSASLSHLFNQAVISAELILGDAGFRLKANQKIAKITDNREFDISVGQRPKVVLGIISKDGNALPKIPFFSKVALRHCKRRLGTFGCTVSIKNIRDTRPPKSKNK